MLHEQLARINVYMTIFTLSNLFDNHNGPIGCGSCGMLEMSHNVLFLEVQQ